MKIAPNRTRRENLLVWSLTRYFKTNIFVILLYITNVKCRRGLTPKLGPTTYKVFSIETACAIPGIDSPC